MWVCLLKLLECPNIASYTNSFSVSKTQLNVANVQKRNGTLRSNSASGHSGFQELKVKFLSHHLLALFITSWIHSQTGFYPTREERESFPKISWRKAQSKILISFVWIVCLLLNQSLWVEKRWGELIHTSCPLFDLQLELSLFHKSYSKRIPLGKRNSKTKGERR